MKKLAFVLALAASLLIATPASAQTGVGFGYTMFNHSGSEKMLEEGIPGFYFGVCHNFATSPLEGLSFEPGVYLVHYGKTFSYLGYAENEYRANYLAIPVNIKYTIEAGSDMTFSCMTGPRFNIGIGGNMFSRGDTYMGLKLTDAQWGIGGALTYSEAIQFRIGYDFGLTKAVKIKGNSADPKIFRNVLHVGVAFNF